MFEKYNFPDDPAAQEIIINRLSDFCGRSLHNYTEADANAPLVWDFYHSFFFSFTVASTVGYGNLAPNSTLGRMIMIVYAIFGMPVHGFLLAQLSQYFGYTFINLYNKYKKYKQVEGSNYEKKRYGLVGQVMLYLIPGFLFFIFLPACLFTLFEDWEYDIAVYYAFVTLTTIGFGDYVAGMQDRGFGIYFVFYKIFLIFWITFGLGYILMCMGFVARGMKSKQIAKLEHKLATNIKATHSRIWNGVTKDVGYLRKILNELYLIRVKPVYKDEGPRLDVNRNRSVSLPNITLYSEEQTGVRRRRANSENLAMGIPDLVRVQSDSDLSRIDKNRTFAVTPVVQPGEFLASVVNALGNYRDDVEEEEDDIYDGGFHGFSDNEILASERLGSKWSIGEKALYAEPPKKPRGRACSECRITMPREYSDPSTDWTWSGTPAASNKIKEIMRARGKKTSLYIDPVGSNIPSKTSTPDAVPTPPISLLGRFNPFRRRTSAFPFVSDDNRYGQTENQSSIQRNQYLAQTRRGRNSAFSLPNEAHNTSVLEETSIADLIRALTALHARENEAYSPKRKMGTACLTPPKLPSLLTLFPPNMDSGQTQNNVSQNAPQPRPRRMSLRPAGFITTPEPPTSGRRMSATPSPTFNHNTRRFSLHPIVSISPPSYEVSNNQNTSRRFSEKPSATPLLSPPSPTGVVPPPRGNLNMRRYSLRPIGVPSSVSPGPVQRQALGSRWRPAQLQRESMGANVNVRMRTRHGSISSFVEPSEKDRSGNL